MRQEKRKRYQGNQRFEEGLLRTDACMQRYSRPRHSQYRSSFEDLPEQSFGLSAVWEEKSLLINVQKLIKAGFKVGASETLEAFVERHREHLEEVI